MEKESPANAGNPGSRSIFWGEAAVLFLFWILMSGKFEPVPIGLGLISVGIVMGLQCRLPRTPAEMADQSLLGRFHRFPLYVPWLSVQMIRATWQVAVIVLSPRMRLDPCLVEFKSDQPHTVARVTLANSITLTPGTLTLELDGDRFRIHALTSANAEELLGGAIPSQVARIFGGSGERAVYEGRTLDHPEEAD